MLLMMGKCDTSQALKLKVELDVKQSQEPAGSGCSMNLKVVEFCLFGLFFCYCLGCFVRVWFCLFVFNC